MIPHHADSVNTPLPSILLAWTFKPGLVRLVHGLPLTSMSDLSYRPEDDFQEALNSQRLKELFAKKDYRGLLEMALLLNRQASQNNSRAYFAIMEASKNMSNEFSLDRYMDAAREILMGDTGIEPA